MPSVRNFFYTEVIKILENNGFAQINQVGSHEVYYRSETDMTVSVPFHGKKERITPGTMSNIIRCSGMAREKWFTEQKKLKKH